jgi:hypothetical protein
MLTEEEEEKKQTKLNTGKSTKFSYSKQLVTNCVPKFLKSGSSLFLAPLLQGVDCHRLVLGLFNSLLSLKMVG